jgi:hypothetical protein
LAAPIAKDRCSTETIGLPSMANGFIFCVQATKTPLTPKEQGNSTISPALHLATHVNIDPRLKNIEKLLIHRGFDGLNDVQTAILVGTLAGESYGNIADRTTYTVEYLREIGSSLWKLLSEVLGEPVTKKNLQVALQRYQKSWAAEELEQQYFWGNCSTGGI